MLLALRSLYEASSATGYVTSPPTQSGVADTKTSITKAFTLFSDGSIQVDYEVSSESGFDFFNFYINNLSTPVFQDSGTGAGRVTQTVAPTSAGSFNVRLEFFKDGSGNDGTDNVVVYEIRTYNSSSVLQETYNFSGTNGTGPPTGWTEILNDGGVPVTGSHWTLVASSSGVTGTLASTLADATSAASGRSVHVGSSAVTLANATSSASGTTVDVGTLAVTLASATSSASGTTAAVGTLAATLANATSAASGTTAVVGTLAATLAAATSAASGAQTPTVSGTLAVRLDAATSLAIGEPRPFPVLLSVDSVELTSGNRSTVGLLGVACRAEINDGGEGRCTARIRPATSYTAELSEG